MILPSTNNHHHSAKEALGESSKNETLNDPLLYVLDLGMDLKPLHAGRILVGHPDGRALRTLVSGQTHPDGIDISSSTGRIYWTNMGIPNANDGTVQSCKLDGSDIQTAIPEGAVHTPKQLIIDQKSNKMYFCDREGLRVMRSNLDGSQHEILIQTGDWQTGQDEVNQQRWCVGISIDHREGKFYWTQKGPSKGARGSIFRAGLEMPEGETPSNRNDIETLFTKLPEPIDIEIDEDTQTLFWTDRGDPPMGNSLNSVKLSEIGVLREGDENPKYNLLAKQLHETVGLKLDKLNKHIYVTDIGGTVYRFDIDGTGKKILYNEECSFSGIALGHL